MATHSTNQEKKEKEEKEEKVREQRFNACLKVVKPCIRLSAVSLVIALGHLQYSFRIWNNCN